MKTKAKDRISMPSGETMTLAEAMDAGRVVLIESTYYDPPRYFARAKNEGISWEIGKTLFLSRKGEKHPFGSVSQDRHGLKPEE